MAGSLQTESRIDLKQIFGYRIVAQFIVRSIVHAELVLHSALEKEFWMICLIELHIPYSLSYHVKVVVASLIPVGGYERLREL